MGFETPESSRPIPLSVDRRFRWMNQRQVQVIDYLREDNRVLREHSAIGDCASVTISVGD